MVCRFLGSWFPQNTNPTIRICYFTVTESPAPVGIALIKEKPISADADNLAASSFPVLANLNVHVVLLLVSVLARLWEEGGFYLLPLFPDQLVQFIAHILDILATAVA